MTQLDPLQNPKIWATLITNANYLTGVLTLHYSLKKVNSKYPLVALYTSQLDAYSLRILHENGISSLEIESIKPRSSSCNTIDKRFADTWSKLYFFKLTQFERIVQLDSDMLVMQNMDELMDISLGSHKFASTHACVCNPLRFSHYPKSWNSSNCVFTNLKSTHPKNTPSGTSGLSKCNSGILVVDPSLELYEQILKVLREDSVVSSYIFPDQDLLADLFYQNWLSLSHNYNCLKTFKHQHPQLWDLKAIKNIHFILSPKPWDVDRTYDDKTGTFELWWDINDERLQSITPPLSD